MMSDNGMQWLSAQLFADPTAGAFAVLDGASVPGLLDQLDRFEPEYECLYRGDLEPDLAEVAPYLVRLQPDSPFTAWVIGEGWGNHWGIFAASPADLREMRHHFRTFLTVHDPEGKPLYFRYYDPRVLRVYLPTCNREELATVFGPVTHYLLEDQDAGALLRFEVKSGALAQEKIALPSED